MVKAMFSSRQNSNEVNDKLIESNENDVSSAGGTVPTSPPPSYDKVVQEKSKRKGSTASKRFSLDEKGPTIFHKSSKELYKAIAKQEGITCKMTDDCRCFECQSHYFECEYDQNENQKTDGGLGAGTPMFISEVMHGTACIIL